MPIFLASLFYNTGNTRFERLRYLVYIFIAVTIIIYIPVSLYPAYRIFLMFFPFMILLAIMFFFHLVDNFQWAHARSRQAVVAVFVIIILLPIVGLYGSWESGKYFKGYWDPLLKKVPKDIPVISDAAAEICWYDDRRTVLIPTTLQFLSDARKRLKVPSCALFSDLWGDYEISGSGFDKELCDIIADAQRGIIRKGEGFQGGLYWNENFLLY